MREKILTFIEKNSRIDLKELAIILGVDEASVVNELQKMEEEHIICGYHTLIDWDKAGIEKVTALIEVRVTPQRGMGFDKVAERIYNYPEVNSVYLISGGFDFMVTIEGKTLREVSQFVSDKLSPLDSVLSTKTNSAVCVSKVSAIFVTSLVIVFEFSATSSNCAAVSFATIIPFSTAFTERSISAADSFAASAL